jgi:hypothetical protein
MNENIEPDTSDRTNTLNDCNHVMATVSQLMIRIITFVHEAAVS